jgi:hypothetical protein
MQHSIHISAILLGFVGILEEDGALSLLRLGRDAGCLTKIYVD